MSHFIPEDIKEAADKIGSNWIKGSEFEGEGLILQIAKPMEKIVAKNPKYGALETNYLVKQEILEIGQTLRFTFNTAEGQERIIDSTSTPFFIGFNQLEELGVGDWVHIVRSGKTDQTRYTVVKVKAPELVTSGTPSLSSVPNYPTEPNPDNIPF